MYKTKVLLFKNQCNLLLTQELILLKHKSTYKKRSSVNDEWISY